MKPKYTQTAMFTSQDTPLFSGAPQRASESIFAPVQEPEPAPSLPMFERSDFPNYAQPAPADCLAYGDTVTVISERHDFKYATITTDLTSVSGGGWRAYAMFSNDPTATTGRIAKLYDDEIGQIIAHRTDAEMTAIYTTNH